MAAKRISKRLLAIFFVLAILVTSLPAEDRGQGSDVSGQKGRPRALHSDSRSAVSRMVLTFYYPWYGIPDGPGGAGKTVHWGRIDAANKSIQASTHYPALGAYDSHDPKVLEQHCRWAKQAGIDAFIISWWGHNSYSDRAMDKILDSCQRNGLSACIYYETVPRPQTPQSAADDIVKVLNKYGKHTAHLKVNGKPVVFVYGRALNQLGLTRWLKAIEIINANCNAGITAIGDRFSYGSARIFDGIHTYNTAGRLRGRDPAATRKWAAKTYPSWVQIADKAGKISTLTVIPGYDDTKIRKPGLAVNRYDGELYRVQWQEAIKANPHWILITSFNEWHEGSEIEPSLEYKQQYLDLTAKYARQFKAKQQKTTHKAPSAGPSIEEKTRLRDKFQALRIGILPDADSMALWWLLDLGLDTGTLTWQDLAGGNLTAQKYPVLLYCAGEHYHRSVHRTGDVDDALVKYLQEDGCLMVLPSLPWPFYYDENGQTVNRSSRFGLNLHMGWEKPPGNTKLHFIQPQHRLPHLPKKFAFPTSGDLRWRPFLDDNSSNYIPLLQLCNGDGKNLGDAVAYAELNGGGQILYAWFGLLDSPFAGALLYDIFDFVTTKLRQ